MWKNILLILGGVAIGVLAFILGSGSNRPRVRDNITRVDKLRGSVGKARDTNNRAREATKAIRADNKAARSGIRAAKDILKAAKERSTNP